MGTKFNGKAVIDMAKISLLFLLLFLCSCAALYQPAKLHEGSDIKSKYEDQIKDWQKRVQQENWSENLVDEIVQTIQLYSDYTIDNNPGYKWKNDYWFTPKEMVEANFKGDCEDIGSLIFGSLKRMKYPYGVRLLIVGTLLPYDHLVVKIQMPNGDWKQYETVKLFLSEIDGLFYRPKLEFDENQIWTYKLK